MNIRLGHDWALDEHIDANCTEGGGDRYKCQRCDETEIRNSVAALGHLWNADAICERCSIAAPPIDYIGASGPATCSDYHVIVGSGDLEVGASTKTNWYAVYGDVNLTTLKFIDKTSNIILKDGAKLTVTSTNANDAISAKSLNIYSESGGSGTLEASCNRSAIYALYSLNIYGGNISATAGNAHAITANESLTIHGGTITARSTTDGNGIFCVIGNIAITGGNISATGSNPIDSYGINASMGTLTLGWTGAGNITANSYTTKDGTVIFARPFRDDEGHVYSGSADAGTLGGKTLINTELIYDNADNDIAAIAGTTNVTLLGRTLYGDGDWNTLCLPFDVPNLNSTPLKDFTVKELDTETAYDGHVTGFDGTTLYLNFKDANSIVAGLPYIVKKNAPTFTPMGGGDNVGVQEMTMQGNCVLNIVDPFFSGVTVSSDAPTPVVSNDGKVTFVGYYDLFNIDTPANDDIYYLTTGNQLMHTGKARTLHPMRAYFQLVPEAVQNVKAFRLSFGENEPLSIINSSGMKRPFGPSGQLSIGEADSSWYDLSGRRFNGKPAKAGLYIHQGKKVIK